MAEIAVTIVMIALAVAGILATFKTEAGRKKLEQKTDKTYAEIKSEFYRRLK